MEMTQKMSTQELKKLCKGVDTLPEEVINWITDENLWNLWVPKNFGGLEFSFSNGLKRLKELAQIDGSLAWTITLVSGANYFIGNLNPQKAQEIFNNGKKPVIGGSGGATGIAERVEDGYILNGTWKYATGSPYLTHVTLNAKIYEDGKPVMENGTEMIRSFILPAQKVLMIDDWGMMGLQATVTTSFMVDEVKVTDKEMFVYNHFYLNEPIFRIPFKVFADLTLWVNYLGMAQHYLVVAEEGLQNKQTENLKRLLVELDEFTFEKATEIEHLLKEGESIADDFSEDLHQKLSVSLTRLTQAIIELHPYIGMRAARLNDYVSFIFRDYFTATQHRNFVDR